MSEISLNVIKREPSTKGELNQLRKSGFVPGIYYSKGSEPVSFKVSELLINPLVFTSDTHIIQLKLDDNEPLRCIIKDVQFDPVTDRVMHLDLLGITMGQLLQLQVPVVLVGTPEGVKMGGLLQHYMHKLDIECLPRHIPEHLEIDISGLKIGDTIHVRDLSFENVKILNAEDTSVAAVTVTRGVAVEEEEVVEGEAKETAEPEVIGKGKSEEDKDTTN